MSEHQSIEEKLRQMIPSAISDAGLEEMDATIDRLTAGAAHDDQADGNPAASRPRGWWRAAAMLALLAVPVVLLVNKSTFPDSPSADNVDATTHWNERDMELVKTTDWVESSVSEGLIIPGDGGVPHHRYQYYIVDEEEVLDRASGIVVTVRQPRHELITVPVTIY